MGGEVEGGHVWNVELENVEKELWRWMCVVVYGSRQRSQAETCVALLSPLSTEMPADVGLHDRLAGSVRTVTSNLLRESRQIRQARDHRMFLL